MDNKEAKPTTPVQDTPQSVNNDDNITVDTQEATLGNAHSTIGAQAEIDDEIDDDLLNEVMGDMDEKLNLTAGERSVGGKLFYP